MGVPSYVINFDELVDSLIQYFTDGIKVDMGNITLDNSVVEALLTQISGKIDGVNYQDLIKALNDLGSQLATIGAQNGISGIQKIYGNKLEIPYVTNNVNDFTLSFIVPARAVITGITYSQSSWNYEDSWDLKIGDELLFKNVYTKEFGEHKYMNKFYGVNSGDIIQFVFHNTSYASKVVWVDFEMIEAS